VLLGNGSTLQLTELPAFHIHNYSLPDLKFADIADAVRFLRSHVQEGDVVLASNPHVVDHFMVSRTSDFWPQSRLYIQALLDDRRTLPLHRIAGTTMISSREEMEALFARHGRIWYVLVPSRHGSQNTADVSAFLRQHMEVVYEDYRALVLFRGNKHRHTSQRLENEKALIDAQTNFLPH
jgi:hypothetical protein